MTSTKIMLHFKSILSKSILPLFFIAIFIFFTHQLSGDGDFFHHANTGKFVLEHFRLPQVDEFTFTATGKSWVGYAWGMGVIYYLIYSHFGGVGVSLLSGFFALITFILLFSWLLTFGIGKKYALIVTALTTSVVSTRWPHRPEIITYPLLISLFIIDQLRYRFPSLVIVYPLLILIWTNLYGASVILGLIVLILLAIKQLIATKFNFKKNRLNLICILISFPISLINGYGFSSLLFIFLIPGITRFDREWEGILKTLSIAPLDYLLVFQYRLLVYFIYLGIICLTSILSIKKLKSNLFLSILALAVFIPFLATRQIPLAAILSTPLLAILISVMKGIKQRILLSLVIGSIIFSAVISLWIESPSLGQSSESFPSYLINFIKNNNLNGRTLNNQQIGAFLTYHFYPNILVFQDTRDDLFLNTKIYEDYQKASASKTGILPLLEKYHINIIIADLAEGPFYQSLFYSTKWAPVFLNDRFLVVYPTQLAKEKNMAILDAIDPFSPTGAKTGHEIEALKQYQSVYTFDPNSLNNQIRLVKILTFLKDFNQAINIVSHQNFGNHIRSKLYEGDQDSLLTQIYFEKRDCVKMKYYLDKLSKDSKQNLIFTKRVNFISDINKDYALYFLLCDKNLSQARYFLNLYLAQNLTPLEKLTAEKEFNNLLKDYQ